MVLILRNVLARDKKEKKNKNIDLYQPDVVEGWRMKEQPA